MIQIQLPDFNVLMSEIRSAVMNILHLLASLLAEILRSDVLPAGRGGNL